MSGITGSLSIPGSVSNAQLDTEPTPIATTSEPTPQTQPAAQRPILIPVNFGLSSLSALGPTQPRSPEDTAALLAAILLSLEETVADTRDNRAVALAGGIRSALGSFLSGLNTMVELSGARAQLEVDLATTTTTRDAKVTQKAALEQQSAQLGQQIGTLNGEISTLNQQIAQAQAANQPTGALVAQRDAKIGQRDGLQAQKNQVDGQITQLAGEINGLNAKIGEINASITANVAQYNSLQVTLLNVFLQAVLAVRELEPADEVIETDRDTKVRITLEEVAEQLEELNDGTQIREILREFQVESSEGRANEERVAVTALTLVTVIADVLATLAALDLPLDSEEGKSAAQSRGRVRVAL